MAGTRNMCCIVKEEILQESRQKLRCVFTRRNIENNLSFNRLDLCRMVIVKNALWAIEDSSKVVVADVMTGERQYEIPLANGVGVTLFQDKIYVYSRSELFEVVDNDNNTKDLVRIAICPHEIFSLCIQRRDESEVTFIVESLHGLIVRAVTINGYARCNVLKGNGHFLCGVYGSHIFIYCLESNDLIDFKNNVIERIFPPMDGDELLGRFRMTQDGLLYYCSWHALDDPWRIECLNAVTGNRTSYEVDSNHVYFIPCRNFVPFYEV